MCTAHLNQPYLLLLLPLDISSGGDPQINKFEPVSPTKFH